MTLGHRTQTPSGASYALENRRVLSRVFPQLFRATGVQRLTPFIEALRLALAARRRRSSVDDPSDRRPLAGFAVGDRVRARVDRRRNSAIRSCRAPTSSVVAGGSVCAPSAVGCRCTSSCAASTRASATRWRCGPNSTLGIPGLVDACRAGTVSVVNTLGSGILENAGLAGAHGHRSRRTCSASDLLLDPVPSWWCGDDAARLARAGQSRDARRPAAVAIDARPRDRHRPSERPRARRPRAAASSTDPANGWARNASFPARLRSSPMDGIEHRAAVLRTFAIAHAGSYVAMPGGLARTATSDPTHADHQPARVGIEGHVGAHAPTRDTASPTSGCRSPTLAAHTPVDALPARAAEHLFWLGRYAERAESTIRLIRTINARRDEFDQSAPGPGRGVADRAPRGPDADHRHLPGLRRRRRRQHSSTTRPRNCSPSSSTSVDPARWRTRSGTCSSDRRGPRPDVGRHVARRRIDAA